MTTGRPLKVFIASPGDVQRERDLALDVIETINHTVGRHQGILLQVLRWEVVTAQGRRAQDAINELVDQCDLFVGILHAKWGTPPGGDNEYTSGFEEEFRRVQARRAQSGRPEIALVFKTIPQVLRENPSDSVSRILALRTEVEDSKELTYQKYDTTDQFSRILFGIVLEFVNGLDRHQNDSDKAVPSPAVPEKTEQNEPYRFDKDALKFLQALPTHIQSYDTESGFDPVDLARLRLIASTQNASGLEERELGVHDANILFRSRLDVALSNFEVRGLIESGLSHSSNDSCPLWFWIFEKAGDISGADFVRFCMIRIRNQAISIGAIRALDLTGENLVDSTWPTFEIVMNTIFAQTSPPEVRSAALSYIGHWGGDQYLETVRAEYGRDNYKTRETALRTLLELLVLTNPTEALIELISSSSDGIEPEIVSRVFESIDQIPASVLMTGLEHASESVRSACIDRMRNRSMFDENALVVCLQDKSPRIRLKVLLLQLADGDIIALPDAKEVLIKRKSRNSFFGFGSVGSTEGLEEYAEYQRAYFSIFNCKELEDMRDEFPDDISQLWFAYVKCATKREDDLILSSPREEYKGFCRPELEDDAAKEKWLGNMDQASADAIAEASHGQKIDLMRELVRFARLVPNELILRYFEKFGRSSDLPLLRDWIKSYDEKHRADNALLMLSPNKHVASATAKTYLALAKDDIEICLRHEGNWTHLAKIIQLMTGRQTKLLSSGVIDEMLHHQSDDVRKSMAIQICRFRTKSDMREILRRYTSGGQYFYNVVHWLDFGISVPKDTISRSFSRGALRF